LARQIDPRWAQPELGVGTPTIADMCAERLLSRFALSGGHHTA